MKGYQTINCVVVINSRLSLTRFHDIEDILCQPHERHKKWADRYVFTVKSKLHFQRLLTWLKLKKIPHEVELTHKFEVPHGSRTR
jgi:hypothetical protein